MQPAATANVHDGDVSANDQVYIYIALQTIS